MIRMHGDHPATCFCCTHFQEEEPDEWLDEPRMYYWCELLVIPGKYNGDTIEDLHTWIGAAQTCEQFESQEEVIDGE